MSHSYFIKNLLNVNDNNIHFQPIVDDIYINNVKTKVFYATLSYEAHTCPHCSSRNVIKYGFKSISIKMMKISGINAILKLKKQRFICKCCKKSFLAKSSLVSKNSSISNDVKMAINLELKKNISQKDIANTFSVSTSTVRRIIANSIVKFKTNYKILPKVLSFDEFKATNDCHANMAFIYFNPDNNKILDILPDRRLSFLEQYFLKYPLKQREKVEYIITDMYTPYIQLIKKCFPKAKLSIDRFHLVQLINRVFNKIRIRVMNNYKNSDERYYRKLKSYWKLLLKDSHDLSENKIKAGRMFDGNFMSQKDIVNYIVNKDKELKISYDLYQDMIYAIRIRNIRMVINLIRKYANIVPKELKRCLKTYRKLILYIKNSLKYSYSNGKLEGINCKIKALNRVSYGFGNFFNYKSRILIMNNDLII